MNVYISASKARCCSDFYKKSTNPATSIPTEDLLAIKLEIYMYLQLYCKW